MNNVKGTHDIFSPESSRYSYVEEVMKSIASLFAFNEIRPPVMEYSEVFTRGVGESSDIVRKEMYTFLDKAERSITLRPEFTAGIARLIVQNKLLATNELPLKSFYLGPVFRYERPQLGRYRQFNQFGVESIGHSSYLVDCEVISLAYSILQTLSLENVKVKINSLGDETSRNNYRNALKEYFRPYIDSMCEDCKSRYELNPLRILDCKIEEDQKIIKNAPKISDYLSESSINRFNTLKQTLEEFEIPFEVDDSLVRGLDYYSETVFEFHYTSKTGNNYGAIGAGGHYDKLVSELGGPNLPGVGFSFGIERIVSVLNDDELFEDIEDSIDFYVMPIGEATRKYALNIANEIRFSGFKVDYCFDDVKLGNMFKRANKKRSIFALIIGDEEMNNNQVVIKNLLNEEQITLNKDELNDFLDELTNSSEDDDDCECDGECCCHNHNHNSQDDDCCCHNHNQDSHDDDCCCHHHDHECKHNK